MRRWPTRSPPATQRQHRHGPHRPGRQHVRERRRAGGLRLSRHPRDDGGGQARRRRVLRRAAPIRLLQRLLHRRPPGADGGAALPGGLQRHRRRCAGQFTPPGRRSARSGSTRRLPSGLAPFRRRSWPTIHAGAMAACDADDGAKDGIIENPLACSFDPGVLACKGADEVSCLTAPQVDAVTSRVCRRVQPADGREDLPGSRAGERAGLVAGAGRLRGGLLQAHRLQGPELGSEDAELRQPPGRGVPGGAPDLRRQRPASSARSSAAAAS